MSPSRRRAILLAAFCLSLLLYLISLSHPSLNVVRSPSVPDPLLDFYQRSHAHVSHHLGKHFTSTGPSAHLRAGEGWLKEQKDGSVLVRKDGDGGKGKGHPIRQLMAEAKVRWEDKLARQSKTLEEAVENYRLRYEKSPPKGFEAYFAFTKANNVFIIDDFDSLHTSILPFLSLPPSLLQSRFQSLPSESLEYTLSISRSSLVTVEGEAAGRTRPQQIKKLFEGFREALPEGFGEEEKVVLSLNDHDLGGKVGNEDTGRRLAELWEAGEYITQEELESLENHGRTDAMEGLLNACARDSPAGREARADDDLILSETEPEPKDDQDILDATTSSAGTARPGKIPITFLRTPTNSYSFCQNPSKLLPYHAQLSRPKEARRSQLSPQVVLSRLENGNQILTTPLEAFKNETKRIPWEERTTEKIFWRGSTTGDFFSQRDDGYSWKSSHRIRLHQLVQAHRGHTDVLVELPSPDPVSSGSSSSSSVGGVSLERFSLRDLNRHLMDVGLASILQCEESDGTCDEMGRELAPLAEEVWPEETLKYKYSLDIDGNAWSSRFRRLMASGSMVFKSTIFPEWNTDWLEPWLHYVPVQIDLSDLYHTSTFFLGTPDGKGAHDDFARTIADAGVDFATNHWRWEDMQAYNFLLLLEYRRMMSEDRDAMSYGEKLRISKS